jgi:hypothetical protein
MILTPSCFYRFVSFFHLSLFVFVASNTNVLFIFLFFPLFFFVSTVGLAQGGVHMLANDFDKRPLRRDRFDLLMQERDRRVKKDAEK